LISCICAITNLAPVVNETIFPGIISLHVNCQLVIVNSCRRWWTWCPRAVIIKK